MADRLRVSWGCGPELTTGWFCSDRDDYGQDHVGELLDGLPLDDGAADIVVANHALQMVPYVELRAALGELVRVLAPGGILRILVPDVFSPLGAVDAYRACNRGWFPIADTVEPLMGGKLAAYGLWYSTARSVFTPAWLSQLVHEAGCSPAVATVGLSLFGRPESTELDSRPTESIVVEGRKREAR